MPCQFSDFYNSLDPDPLKRGKQFEHFVKWFLKADPEWATQVDQVWLWDAFTHLSEYAQTNGHCRVPALYKTLNGYPNTSFARYLCMTL